MHHNRKLQQVIEKWLTKKKVLVVIGPRQVGKTTLMEKIISEFADECEYLNCEIPAIKQQFQDISIENFKRIIGNNKLLILDEVQQIENIGLCLKIMHDNFKDQVKIIATGSSALDISDKIFEPLTGRHLLFNMYPLALSEIYTKSKILQIEQNLSWHLVYGMYPDVLNDKANAEKYIVSLCGSYLYKDVLAWKDIRKPEMLNKILQLLAYQICNEVNMHELSQQLGINVETLESYISLLEKSFVVFRLSSFSNNPRKEIAKMKKIYFYDNGIRNAIIGNFNPLIARNDSGVLWENFIINERMKHNSYNEKNIRTYFWRTYNQQEIDYIEKENEMISAYEMKWSESKKNKITKAFTNLYPDAHSEIITPKSISNFVY